MNYINKKLSKRKPIKTSFGLYLTNFKKLILLWSISKYMIQN